MDTDKDHFLFIEAPKFTGDIKQLSEQVEKGRGERQDKVQSYIYSETPPIMIIRNSIKYFNELENGFLGKSYYPDDPNEKVDFFANNLYRLYKSILTLSKYSGQGEFKFNSDFCKLMDFRTLIVHNGDKTDKLAIINDINDGLFSVFKDVQLYSIAHVAELRASRSVPLDNEIKENIKKYETDYRFNLLLDMQTAPKNKRHTSTSREDNDDCIDLFLYISAKDVRHIVLRQIEKFIVNYNPAINYKYPKLPDKKVIIKDGVVDFDKMASIIKSYSIGGYVISDDDETWGGFGIKRFLDYVENKTDLDPKLKKKIKNIVINEIGDYIDKYNSLSDETFYELPYFDLVHLLAPYLSKSKLNKYDYFNEKLFLKISPYFNSKEFEENINNDYLYDFLLYMNENGIKLEFNGSTLELICDYYIELLKLNKRIKE